MAGHAQQARQQGTQASVTTVSVRVPPGAIEGIDAALARAAGKHHILQALMCWWEGRTATVNDAGSNSCYVAQQVQPSSALPAESAE